MKLVVVSCVLAIWSVCRASINDIKDISTRKKLFDGADSWRPDPGEVARSAERRWYGYGPPPPPVRHHHNEHRHQYNETHQHLHDQQHEVDIHLQCRSMQKIDISFSNKICSARVWTSLCWGARSQPRGLFSKAERNLYFYYSSILMSTHINIITKQ